MKKLLTTAAILVVEALLVWLGLSQFHKTLGDILEFALQNQANSFIVAATVIVLIFVAFSPYILPTVENLGNGESGQY